MGKLLGFLQETIKLKTIPRSGWITQGISLKDIESVGDHTFSTCALSLLLADMEAERGARVNVERVLRLAVFHDLSESLTFDISKQYLRYIGKRGEEIKKELDDAAWNHLLKKLKNTTLAGKYRLLQSEFNDEKTVESRIVHAADKLDILLQVLDYRRRGYPDGMFKELWETTNRKLKGSGVLSVRRLRRIVERARERRQMM